VQKDMMVAYLLAIFLGGFGAHQFYLRNTGSGVTQLVLTLIGAVTSWFFVGLVLLFGVFVWVVVDLFLIPGWVRQSNGQQL
jgi:TM2 domain-containing membrane protein YozV